MPTLSSGLLRVKPFTESGTRKAVIPLCPFDRSVTAKTRTTSACGPLVMKFLVPFRTYSSPFFTATVRISAASEPLVRLGEGVGAQPLAAGEGDQELVLLVVGAELVDRVAVERVVHAHDHAGAGAAARDLLHGHRVADVVHAGAAQLGGDGDPEEPQLGELLHRVGRGTGGPRPSAGRWGGAPESANWRQSSRTWRCSSVSWMSIDSPSACQAPWNRGGALLDEGLQPFLAVGGPEEHAEGDRLHLLPGGELRPGRGPQDALGGARRPPAPARRSCGPGDGRARGASPGAAPRGRAPRPWRWPRRPCRR